MRPRYARTRQERLKMRKARPMKYYEIISVDAMLAGKSKTTVLSEAAARKLYGKEEWNEIKQGYLPHLIVSETDKPEGK